MILSRSATESRESRAIDLSGAGAARGPGRWNAEREPVVYCAPTIAIAVSETAAHVDDSGLPLNKYLVELQVPDSVWVLREELVLEALPPTWGAIPAGAASVEIGSRWLSSLRSPLLIVPSVIAPEESASLINPRHPEATKITAKAVRRFEYNRLFRS